MSVAFWHPAARPRDTDTAGVLFVRFVRLRSVVGFVSVLLLGMAVVGVGTLVLAWHLASRWGLVEDVERLMLELGFESFELRPDQLLDVVLVGAAVGVIVGTLLAVLGAALFNLVSWITGGIELTTRERRSRRR